MTARMKWRRNQNTYLGGWLTIKMVTPHGYGYWLLRKDKSSSQYHLNLMETRHSLIGGEVTTTIFHKSFDSMKLAKSYAEGQQNEN